MAWVVCLPGWGAAAAAGALLLYGTLDVAYFARMMYTVAKARYFKKKACLLDTTEVHSWCLLNDIDTLLYHMNNARYLRELDFARADFYERTGLYANIKAAGGAVVQAAATIRYRRYIKPFTKFTITSKVMEVVACFYDTIGSYFYERTGLYANIKAAGGAVVQAAATIRYRRYIKPFTKFTITSKAIYWDDKTVFMEHEFVGPGGFVHAVAVCRQRVIDTSAAAIAELLLQLHCAGTCHPPVGKMPPELELWVQSNELSSAKLRGTSMPIGTLPSPQSHAHAGCGEVLPNTGLE